MIEGDAREKLFLTEIRKADRAIVVMEGISMYLSNEEVRALLQNINHHFGKVSILMDCYTTLAAKASQYKNPINDVGVTQVYGLDEPRDLECKGLAFVKEHDMTPDVFINELEGMEKAIFKKLYSGGIAKKMYRMYEYTQR